MAFMSIVDFDSILSTAGPHSPLSELDTPPPATDFSINEGFPFPLLPTDVFRPASPLQSSTPPSDASNSPPSVLPLGPPFGFARLSLSGGSYPNSDPDDSDFFNLLASGGGGGGFASAPVSNLLSPSVGSDITSPDMRHNCLDARWTAFAEHGPVSPSDSDVASSRPSYYDSPDTRYTSSRSHYSASIPSLASFPAPRPIASSSHATTPEDERDTPPHENTLPPLRFPQHHAGSTESSPYAGYASIPSASSHYSGPSSAPLQRPGLPHSGANGYFSYPPGPPHPMPPPLNSPPAPPSPHYTSGPAAAGMYAPAATAAPRPGGSAGSPYFSALPQVPTLPSSFGGTSSTLPRMGPFSYRGVPQTDRPF